MKYGMMFNGIVTLYKYEIYGIFLILTSLILYPFV